MESELHQLHELCVAIKDTGIGNKAVEHNVLMIDKGDQDLTPA